MSSFHSNRAESYPILLLTHHAKYYPKIEPWEYLTLDFNITNELKKKEMTGVTDSVVAELGQTEVGRILGRIACSFRDSSRRLRPMPSGECFWCSLSMKWHGFAREEQISWVKSV